MITILTGVGAVLLFDLHFPMAVYCHPAYITYVQSMSCKMLGWMNHKLKIKVAGRNINNLRYADDTTLMAESEELKSLLDTDVKNRLLDSVGEGEGGMI